MLGVEVLDRSPRSGFAPGTRAAWHSHARSSPTPARPSTARPGGSTGHGAAADPCVECLAMLDASTTTWLEHLTDEEYQH